MKIFKPVRAQYLVNELKSWLGEILFAANLFIIFKFLFGLATGKIMLGLAIIVLMKAVNTFTQYHVSAIRIDPSTSSMTVILSSLFFGLKENHYDLQTTRSAIIQKKKTVFSAKTIPVLEIYLAAGKTFIISGRYGFAASSLEAINNCIQQTQLANNTKLADTL